MMKSPESRKLPHGDLTGKRFGRLVVLNLSEKRDKKGRTMWDCRCDCGNALAVRDTDITDEKVMSCGCLNSDNRRDLVNSFRFKGTNIVVISKKGLDSRNTSSTTGVTQIKSTKKWRASISIDGRNTNLGHFDNIEDAISARKAAEERYYQPVIEEYNRLKNKAKLTNQMRSIDKKDLTRRKNRISTVISVFERLKKPVPKRLQDFRDKVNMVIRADLSSPDSVALAEMIVAKFDEYDKSALSKVAPRVGDRTRELKSSDLATYLWKTSEKAETAIKAGSAETGQSAADWIRDRVAALVESEKMPDFYPLPNFGKRLVRLPAPLMAALEKMAEKNTVTKRQALEMAVLTDK